MPLIPEGPLHPELLFGGLLTGVGVVTAAWFLPPSRRAIGPAAAVVAAYGVLGAGGQAPWSVSGLSAGELAVGLVLAVVGAVAVGAAAVWGSWRGALLTVGVATATAWGTVPDTEAPLVVGAVLLPVFVAGMVRPGRGSWDGPLFALVAVGVVVAAVVGNRGGRPAQLVPTMVVLIAGAAVTPAFARATLRRRAGRSPR